MKTKTKLTVTVTKVRSFPFKKITAFFKLCMFQDLDLGQNGLIVPAPAPELVIVYKTARNQKKLPVQ